MATKLNRKGSAALAAVRQALEQGRPHDAWAQARQLIAARRTDVATLNLAGVAAFQAGERETAGQLLGQAAAKAPKNAEVQMNLGNVLMELGDEEHALQAYEAANGAELKYSEPAYNAGVLELARGRNGEAVEWFSNALDRNPDHIQAAVGYAEALKRQGDLAGAQAALDALCEKRPEDAIAHTNLAAVLSALGDDAGARLAAEKAVAFDPGLAEAHFNQGVAELALGNHAAARERFKYALGLNPENAAAALNMGEAALLGGDRVEAERAFRRALDIDPEFAKAAINLADLPLSKGRPEAALEIIDTFLRRVPGQPAALAFKAIALRDADRVDVARVIDDLERFILPRQISVPDGFSDLAAFNDALADHVAGHPTLMPAPAMHATRSGGHSGELLAPPWGPMADFEIEVREGFRSYAETLGRDAAHPFLGACPTHFSLSVWGVVMDRDGHQVPHIHPSAWLSGVYYVEVPDSIRDDDTEKAGWIEFGRPPEDIHATSEPNVRFIKPEPGKMILFPSHFYHRTVPLAGDQRRISIAFDIVASDAN